MINQRKRLKEIKALEDTFDAMYKQKVTTLKEYALSFLVVAFGGIAIAIMIVWSKTIQNILNLDGKLIDEGDINDSQEEDIEMSVLDHIWLGAQTVRKVAEKYRGHIPKNIFGGKNEAIVTFTSGSTSGPKPMVFTNKSLIALHYFPKPLLASKCGIKKSALGFLLSNLTAPTDFGPQS